MAWSENLSALKANIRLNNGTSSTGNILMKNISVGTLNPATWDVDKFGAIATAAEPIFSRAIQELQSVKTYTVMQS